MKTWIKKGHNTQVFELLTLAKIKLWTYKSKKTSDKQFSIYVPKLLRETLTEWYHEHLQHSGGDKLTATIKKYFNCPGIGKTIVVFSSSCNLCQKYEIFGPKKYGKIPFAENVQDIYPWDYVYIGMTGLWNVKIKLTNKGKMITVKLQVLTMIDRATTWPEFTIYQDVSALTNARLFDKEWICCYPRPTKVIHDNGNEFIGKEF